MHVATPDPWFPFGHLSILVSIIVYKITVYKSKDAEALSWLVSHGFRPLEPFVAVAEEGQFTRRLRHQGFTR
jgi:hypothetical protein